jgi:hypothetical protein
MSRKKPRSPQDKKGLSYAKDRRNTYGENDKASRKLIPLRKAMENRQDRRKVAQEVAMLPKLEEAAADVLESSVRHDVHRVGGWRKGADEPLGKIVANAMAARETRAGRKMRSAEAAAGLVPDDPDILTQMGKRFRRIARWITRRNPMLKGFARNFDRSADDLEARAVVALPQDRPQKG